MLVEDHERAHAGARHDRPRLVERRGTFTDTGCGIPADVLPLIFDPFFTTKPEGLGTGLGLSMVYGLLKQSGGEVTVESTPGRGTTFRVLLREAPQSGRRPSMPSGPLGLRDVHPTTAGSSI